MPAAIASMYPPNEEHPVFYHFKCVEGINSLDMKSVIAYLKVCMAYVAGEISDDLLLIVSSVSTGRKADLAFPWGAWRRDAAADTHKQAGRQALRSQGHPHARVM